MEGDKTSPTTPLHQISLHESKDIWCVSDMSLLALDKVALTGCQQKSKKTFVKVFSDPICGPDLFYSQEFNIQFTSDLWRLVSFLDDIHLVTCFDDQVEKISMKNDKTVQSWKLPQGSASCISVKEREIFIGFSGSCDIIVLNSNLRQLRTVTLDGLEDGWPVDLIVLPDMILVCSFGCVPRRALCFGEKDGQLLREYTNPRSDESVPLSLTVSAEADLVAILWNSPPRLTIHSFSHGHCLVVADVEPAERIRSVGKDQLAIVDEKGDLKVFLLEQIFTFNNLKTILTLLLAGDDCKDIEDFFDLSCDQDGQSVCRDTGEENQCQDMKNDKLLTLLDESGVISAGNVTSLLEALRELDKSDSLIRPVEAYQKYSGRQRGRKRTRKKLQVRLDNPLKRKRITKEISPEDDKIDESTRQEDQPSSDTKHDTSADDADKYEVTTSSEEAPLQEVTELPKTESIESKMTPELGEIGSPNKKERQETGSAGEENIEAGMNGTDQEGFNDSVEQGERGQWVNDRPALKKKIGKLLGEIQSLKQQNELILSLLKTHMPSLNLYKQQYTGTDQCSQQPSQGNNVNTQGGINSQSIQQVHAPSNQGVSQDGLAQRVQPHPPRQLQSLPATQPMTALPPSQPTNPFQSIPQVTPFPQVQFPTHPGAQIPPCTCKVPPPQATNVLTQATVPVPATPGTAVPSCHQPSNTVVPSTSPSKSLSHTPTSAIPSHVPSASPLQPPNPQNLQMAAQQSAPIYAYNHPAVLPYFSGVVPTGSHVQVAPHSVRSLAPSLPQEAGQPASNLPSQGFAQPYTLPSAPQHLAMVPPAQISDTLSSQATNVQPLSQYGALPALPTSNQSSGNPISLCNQAVMDQPYLQGLWDSLPHNVQVDISPHSGTDEHKSRDRIARRLIRHYFSSEVRARSNCKGVLGYEALDADKLNQIKCLIFYLCPVRARTTEAESREWKRLMKVIDTFNRNHRRFANTKKAFLNFWSDQEYTENIKSGE